ncbi:zinc finger protein kipf-like isoform X2 [Drosophila sulfurigaster albostrigata]|uniref:zinc finger protein kipf-like isoform X2 n=1 Tax=Drosophila sulfurigaster albostrigata TaxID=89887 RepID=UPI002D21B502|nr:zinc finger protein kipf-like isoform X2 [Drosophila sulfurigaster albostrigata]
MLCLILSAETTWTLSVKSVTSLNKIAMLHATTRDADAVPPQQSSVHTCPRCDKAYTYKKNLWRHLRFECGRLPTEKCQHCHYVARYKHSLNMHMKTQHPDQVTAAGAARGLFEAPPGGKLI